MKPSWTLVIIGLTFVVISSLIYYYGPEMILGKRMTHLSDKGTSGDAFGGSMGPLVGLLGAAITFLAFWVQYQANQVQIRALNEQKQSSTQQEKQIALQQFENNFFELLKLHRENVKEMKYRGAEGRDVFIRIINQFFEIVIKIQESQVIQKNRLDDEDLINISYIITFFGIDETVQDVLENRLHEKYHSIYDSTLQIIKQLRGVGHTNRDGYYFNGHHSRLGHYFRHLMRTIWYVHKSPVLDDKQKKEYVRIIRSQLSDHEQILLFFNSVSDLGKKWELDESVSPEDKLITRYNLIKNIPLGSIYGFRPKRYYPFLKIEHDFEIRL